MKIKIFRSTILPPGLLSGSLQAQKNVTCCEQVTGLQYLWDTLLDVSSGGFLNTGTAEYSLVRSLVCQGGFSGPFDEAVLLGWLPRPYRHRRRADCPPHRGDEHHTLFKRRIEKMEETVTAVTLPVAGRHTAILS